MEEPGHSPFLLSLTESYCRSHSSRAAWFRIFVTLQVQKWWQATLYGTIRVRRAVCGSVGRTQTSVHTHRCTVALVTVSVVVWSHVGMNSSLRFFLSYMGVFFSDTSESSQVLSLVIFIMQHSKQVPGVYKSANMFCKQNKLAATVLMSMTDASFLFNNINIWPLRRVCRLWLCISENDVTVYGCEGVVAWTT